MPPYQGGGAMIDKVSFEKTTFNGLPNKFEAGTPHIAGVICLKSALEANSLNENDSNSNIIFYPLMIKSGNRNTK